MGEYYTYTKHRYEYDKWPLNFKDTEVMMITPNIKVEMPEEGKDHKDYPYVRRDPNFIHLTNVAEFSQHRVSFLITYNNFLGEY